MAAPVTTIAAVVMIIVVVLVLVLALLLRARRAPPAGGASGGSEDPAWWDADVTPRVRKAVRAYARRSIVPSLKRNDKAPFDRALRAALQDGPKRAALAEIKRYLRRSRLAGRGAGRGEAGRADWRAREVVELLPLNASGPYLDLGCGDGTITARVGKNIDARPTCVEVGPRPKGFPRNVRRVDAGAFAALPDEEFGVVTALMSLHHLTDPEGTIKQVARVTRPGGVFVVREHDLAACSLPSPEEARQYLDWIHIMYDLAEGLDPQAFVRSRYRTPDEWSAVLCEAGFSATGRVQRAGDRVCSYFATYLRK
jgi:SAM-dependent methyltransferase